MLFNGWKMFAWYKRSPGRESDDTALTGLLTTVGTSMGLPPWHFECDDMVGVQHNEFRWRELRDY